MSIDDLEIGYNMVLRALNIVKESLKYRHNVVKLSWCRVIVGAMSVQCC